MGISGNQVAVESLLDRSTGEEEQDLSILLSLIILETSEKPGGGIANGLYGDLFGLQREVVADAHTLAAVVDACGKAEKGGLAASLCMRSASGLDDAWEAARTYRLQVIGALDLACGTKSPDGFYEVSDVLVTSDVADALAYDCTDGQSVVVLGKSGDICHVSARCPRGGTRDIGAIIHELAVTCGGKGGGHRLRAGATIPCRQVEQFRSAWREALAS
jgi:hypothetical protein